MATTARPVRQLKSVGIIQLIYKKRSFASVISTTILDFLQPRVAIVILNWNGRKFLEQFLPSVTHTTYSNAEIIIADNASTDDSLAFLQFHYPQLRVIQNAQNFGFAKGYNEALRQVQADYFVLLNSDVEVPPGWLEPLVNMMQNDPTIAACQPKLLQYLHKDTFEYAGGAGGWMDYLGYPFAKGRIFDVYEKDEGQYDEAGPIFWASGAAMCVRAPVFSALNGFDEFFFAHQEEIDLCWRMQLAGHSIYSCPASVVYHLGAGTLPKGNARKVFFNFRNNLVMLAKNLPPEQALWKLPLRFVLDYASAFKSLFSGQSAYFGALVKAYFAFFGWLFARKDRRFFPPTRRAGLKGYSRKCVAWQHFVRGKTKFSEIVTAKN